MTHQIIENYRELESAARRLMLTAIQPKANELADLWGIDFWAGMGAWGYRFPLSNGEYEWTPYSNYSAILAEDFLPLLPKSKDTLQLLNAQYSSLHTRVVGEELEDYDCDSIYPQSFVIIEAEDEWCVEEPKKLLIKELGESLNPENCFIPLCTHLAKYVVSTYRKDFEKGSELLGYIPWLGELKKITDEN